MTNQRTQSAGDGRAAAKPTTLVYAVDEHMPGMGRAAIELFRAEARRCGYAEETIDEACTEAHRGARLAADDLAAKVTAATPPGEPAEADNVRAALSNSRREPNRDAAKMTGKLMRSILVSMPEYRPLLSASPAPPYELFPLICRLADAERAEKYLTGRNTVPWNGHYTCSFPTGPGEEPMVAFGEDHRAFGPSDVGYIRLRAIGETTGTKAVAVASKRIWVSNLRPDPYGPRDAEIDLRTALTVKPEYSLLIELKDRPGEKREEEQYGVYRLGFAATIRDRKLHRLSRTELMKVERSDVHRGADTRWRTLRKSPETGRLLDWLADAIIDPDEGCDAG